MKPAHDQPTYRVVCLDGGTERVLMTGLASAESRRIVEALARGDRSARFASRLDGVA